MKVEFLTCGSPNDAFYSQIAFFRMCLDALGGEWREARYVAVFGDLEQAPLPERWRPHFERIEVHHADPGAFRRYRFYAAGDLRYQLVDPGADVSVLVDADTALIRSLPDGFLAEMERDPAVCAVPAHYPFRVTVDSRPRFGPEGLYPGLRPEECWKRLGRLVVGGPVELSSRHTLRGWPPLLRRKEGESAVGSVRRRLAELPSAAVRRNEHIPCPLYPNYGFVAATPNLLTALAETLFELQPLVAELIGNDYYGQVTIPLALAKAGIPGRALPITFNYPNASQADAIYPDSVARISLLHYLRTRHFDRHEIFATAAAFDHFMGLRLGGSNAEFQRHVRRLTGGSYPFGGDVAES